MARLSIGHLRKTYGDLTVVDDVTIDVADGEFLVLLGPSGCGKTTTLRMVAGFVPPSAGKLTIGERDVTALPPWKRNCGLVFQSYALFPHMTVAENVAFGLEMRKVAQAERGTRVAEALRLVQLTGFDGRYPRQLSGGQQQRVALAARWPWSRTCSCSTSRSPISMPSSGRRSASRSATCSASSA
jgi:putative spermidine/putrescine transport system ATP-binding protein